jgi:hypothetical protein
MTMYQQNLLDEAVDMWERGYRIPLYLWSAMAAEGLDVLTLEDKHFTPKD